MTGPKIKEVMRLFDANRRTRKPLPGGLRAWRNEVNGCLEFVNHVPKKLGKGGMRWYESMCDYYMDRMFDLINYPPYTLFNTAEYQTTREKVIACLRYHGVL